MFPISAGPAGSVPASTAGVDEHTIKRRLAQLKLVHDYDELREQQQKASIASQADRRRLVIQMARYAMFPEPGEEAQGKQPEEDKMEVGEVECKGSKRKQKNAAVRKEFAHKLILQDYMIKVPHSLAKHWLVYGMPEGKKCLVSAVGKKTIVRDKNGYVIRKLNTLLPNGNKNSKEGGKSLLQGVLETRSNIIYVTDVIMWKNELMVDEQAEFRLFVLFGKILEIRDIGTKLIPDNELLFRFPNVYDCSRAGLEKAYYGPSAGATGPELAKSCTQVAEFVKSNNLESLVQRGEDGTTAESAVRVCAAFGSDNAGAIYLKDGIAFVNREGALSFGYSADYLQWKDRATSPFYDAVVETPSTASLLFGADRVLRTHDDYTVVADAMVMVGLEPDKCYMFAYEGVAIEGRNVTLKGLRMVKVTSRVVCNTISQLLFKCLAREDFLPFAALLQQVAVPDTTTSMMVDSAAEKAA